MRKIWRQHFMNIHGIVYVVDSSDSARFEESRKEFEEILKSEELGEIPIVILANKIDKREAHPEEELMSVFGLKEQTNFGTQIKETLQKKPVKLFSCSVVKKTGIQEAFDWLTTKLK